MSLLLLDVQLGQIKSNNNTYNKTQIHTQVLTQTCTISGKVFVQQRCERNDILYNFMFCYWKHTKTKFLG